MEPLRIDSLVKDYATRRALDEVSLVVQPGHRLGLLGPNGAGKTTLLSILAGVLSATSGLVTLGSHDPRRHPEVWRRLLGYLPQSFDFPPGLTGREALEQAALTHGLGMAEGKKRTVELVRAFRFEETAGRVASGYSIGMKQRLGFACALAGHPAVLLLDEPTSGLDPIERRLFRETLREGLSESQITILSTHIVGDIEHCCDQVAVLGQGRLLFHGAVGDLATLARGKVCQVQGTELELTRWKDENRLVSARPEGTVFLARVLGEEKPSASAQGVDSNLEDGYRLLLMQSGVEAAA